MPALPTIAHDGYLLQSGVQRHAEAPDTFYLPPLEDREGLTTGDLVKLIFEIAIDGSIHDTRVERMWVIVESAEDGLFRGKLDNEPYCQSEGDITIGLGDTVIFASEHVIEIQSLAETEQRQAEQQRILSEITRDQAVDLLEWCKDKQFLAQTLEAGVPVYDIFDKFGLSLE